MFEHHFGLRENPFVAGHHAKFVYPSPEHQEALAHLRFGIENREPFVLITGEVGTGKTTALYDALSEWQSRVVVALINNSALTRNELLEEIALRFGVAVAGPASKPQILAQLERQLTAIHARGDRAILLLDEAQNLERDLLEEIRLLSNLESGGLKLVQVFLVGQPELETKLASHELRQLRQRITVHYRLNPLSAEDTERYIHHRISVAGGHALSVFPTESCRAVHQLTHGIPREINNVCGQALLNAFVEDARAVRPEHVLGAADETEFRSVLAAGAARPVAPAPPRPVEMPAPPRGVAVAPPAPPTPQVLEDDDDVDDLEPPTLEEEMAESEAIEGDDEDVNGDSGSESDDEDDSEDDADAFDERDDEEEDDDEYGEDDEDDEQDEDDEDADADDDREPLGEVTREDVTPLEIPAIDQWMSAFAEAQRRVPAEPLPGPVGPGRASAPPAGPASRPPGGGEIPRVPAPRPTEVSRPIEASRPAAEPTPRLVTPARADVAPRETATPSRRSLADEQRAALPPRLREKLDQGVDFDDDVEEGGGVPRWLLVAGGVAVVVVAAILFFRFGPTSRSGVSHVTVTPATTPPPPPPASNRAPIPATGGNAPAPPSAAAKPAGSTPSATPSAAKPAAVTSASKPAPSSSGVSTTTAQKNPGASPVPVRPATAAAAPATTAHKPAFATPKPVASTRSYGLAVGTFLNEDRANQERDKLAASSGQSVRVSSVTEDGGQVFQLVLGAYSDRASAEKAASDLIRRGLVDEARVVPLAAKP
ncbi:MAG TPA: AAA family ATPase [Candidatus Saccharimonadaceae bacterium]|jgi:general secretion pathway protein A|nr:AAA family ATPase [Candidatus Saccharimonadaceae bacterium]